MSASEQAPDPLIPRCLQGGPSFAARKAEAEANRAVMAHPVLVSLGWSEYTQLNARTKKYEVIPVELFYDLAHPSRRYVRGEGDTQIQPLFETAGTTTKVVEHYEGQLRRPTSSAYPETVPDPPRRPVGTFSRRSRPMVSSYAETTFDD